MKSALALSLALASCSGTGAMSYHAPTDGTPRAIAWAANGKPGVYVSAGASTAYGTGASHAWTPRAPYTEVVVYNNATNFAALVGHAFGVYQNVAYGGWTTQEMIDGRTIVTWTGVKTYPSEPSLLDPAATLITLHSGGNDVGNIAKGSYSLADWERSYDNLIAAFKAKAPAAHVVLLNLRNHYTSAGDVAAVQAMDRFIDAHYPAYPVVDIACRPELQTTPYLYQGLWTSPHFNDQGHALIAQMVLDQIARPTAPGGCI